MTIIGQLRATREVHHLRHRILAAEEELASALDGDPQADDEPAAEVTALRRRLALLLRTQADLLESSSLARGSTMLPSPEHLRHDADLLEGDTAPGGTGDG